MNNFNQELLDFINWKTRVCSICGEREWAKDMKEILNKNGSYCDHYLCQSCFDKTKKIK